MAGEQQLQDRAQLPLEAEGGPSLPAVEGVLRWMHVQFQPARAQLVDGSATEYVFRVKQGAPSPTLLVARDVFDRYSLADIVTALERSHVAARLRSNPITRLRCVDQDGHLVVVERQDWGRSRVWGPRGAGEARYPPSHSLRLAAETVEALVDPVVVTGLDSCMLTANCAAAQLFARPVSELRGAAISALVTPAERQRVAKCEHRALAGEEQRYTTVVLRPDGRERVVAVAAKRLVLEGCLIGILAMLRDITQ